VKLPVLRSPVESDRLNDRPHRDPPLPILLEGREAVAASSARIVRSTASGVGSGVRRDARATTFVGSDGDSAGAGSPAGAAAGGAGSAGASAGRRPMAEVRIWVMLPWRSW
jgi:hypothetical protein